MHDEPPPSGLRRLDRHFRWRGSDVSRLEAFTDAVFAMVLGLLFLRVMPTESFRDLWPTMKSFVPFALTFAMIAYVWFEHWLFSRRYDLQDGLTTFLNLLLLFLLLFYAYPLKFLFTLVFVQLAGPIGNVSMEAMLHGQGGEAGVVRLFVIYGAGFASIFGVLTLMYAPALHFADELRLDPVERFLTRSGMVQTSLQAGVGILSIVLALTGIGLRYGVPGWIYAGIGPVMGIHGAREGRRLRMLQRAVA